MNSPVFKVFTVNKTALKMSGCVTIEVIQDAFLLHKNVTKNVHKPAMVMTTITNIVLQLNSARQKKCCVMENVKNGH